MSHNRSQHAEGVSAWCGVSEGLAGLLGGKAIGKPLLTLQARTNTNGQ